MSFAILRLVKHKGWDSGGIQAHHEREKESYKSNPDIDPSRAHLNYHFVTPTESYAAEIERRIQAARCPTRKDSVRFVDTMLTASPEFFEGKTPEQVKGFFADALEFMAQEIGEHNIFTAVVHLDERNPHMHLCFTPITKDNRLTAKDIVGDRKRMVEWQDRYFKFMVQRHPELERGKSAELTARKHVPTQLYKQAEQMDKQVQKVQGLVHEMRITNLANKRDEVVQSLDELLPTAGAFSADIRAVENSLQKLRRECAEMGAELHQMRDENAVLRYEKFLARETVKEKQKLLDRIPEEIRLRYLPRGQNLQRQK